MWLLANMAGGCLYCSPVSLILYVVFFLFEVEYFDQAERVCPGSDCREDHRSNQWPRRALLPHQGKLFTVKNTLVVGWVKVGLLHPACTLVPFLQLQQCISALKAIFRLILTKLTVITLMYLKKCIQAVLAWLFKEYSSTLLILTCCLFSGRGRMRQIWCPPKRQIWRSPRWEWGILTFSGAVTVNTTLTECVVEIMSSNWCMVFNHGALWSLKPDLKPDFTRGRHLPWICVIVRSLAKLKPLLKNIKNIILLRSLSSSTRRGWTGTRMTSETTSGPQVSAAPPPPLVYIYWYVLSCTPLGISVWFYLLGKRRTTEYPGIKYFDAARLTNKISDIKLEF